MTPNPETERRNNYPKFRNMIMGVLDAAEAKREANRAAWNVFNHASLAQLQYLQSQEKEEQAQALAFFAETLPQAAVTLANGKINMSKKDAEEFTGVDPEYIMNPDIAYVPRQTASEKSEYKSPFEIRIIDDGSIGVYTYHNTAIMYDTFESGDYTLLIQPFAAILEKATKEKDFQLVFEMCRLVRTYEPTPCLLPQDSPQIAE